MTDRAIQTAANYTMVFSLFHVQPRYNLVRAVVVLREREQRDKTRQLLFVPLIKLNLKIKGTSASLDLYLRFP